MEPEHTPEPFPSPYPLTRQTNQIGPRESYLDNDHDGCDVSPCASCVNGILLEMKRLDMKLPIHKERLAHLNNLLRSSPYYPLETSV